MRLLSLDKSPIKVTRTGFGTLVSTSLTVSYQWLITKMERWHSRDDIMAYTKRRVRYGLRDTIYGGISRGLRELRVDLLTGSPIDDIAERLRDMADQLDKPPPAE